MAKRNLICQADKLGAVCKALDAMGVRHGPTTIAIA